MEEFDFTNADLDVCPCMGTGWLAGEWVFSREPKCDCPAHSDDFTHVLHAVNCDAVPCPFHEETPCVLSDP